MKAIAVDDEVYMLETLEEAVRASSDISQVECFSTCSGALAYATENPIDIAFLVLDPRQEADYARGLTYFLDHIPAKTVYPMHFWDDPAIIEKFLREYPQYTVQRTQ